MDVEKWDIGEFASLRLEENKNTFKICIEGDCKYKWMILNKINNIEITQEDLVNNELE